MMKVTPIISAAAMGMLTRKPYASVLVILVLCLLGVDLMPAAAQTPINHPKWSLRIPDSTTPAEEGGTMAYDISHQQTILFSGMTTWALKGDAWRRLWPVNSPCGREGFALAYDNKRSCIVLYGGVHYTVGWTPVGVPTLTPTYYGDTWEWNGSDWTLRITTSLPPAGDGFAMAYDTNRQLCVLLAKGKTYEWNGTKWVQRTPTLSPPERTYGAMVYDTTRQRTVLFGGMDASSKALNDTWEWNGSNWIKISPATTPPVRVYAAMAYDGTRHRTVLFGGRPTPIGDSANSLGDTWEWDGTNWKKATPSLSPSPRHLHTMTYDAQRRQVILFGGSNADTWMWDGAKWTPLWGSEIPQINYHKMAYDKKNKKIILFGGIMDEDSSFSNHTFEWDGTHWRLLFPATSPAPRFSHDMVYDEKRERIVLYGGGYDDTWEWDGTNWLKKAPANSPPALTGHAMAYDRARSRVVLFGGRSSADIKNETWEWDGVNWSKRNPPHCPPARSGHAMAYDAARGKTVMFGGFINGGSDLLRDTWEWDGTDWIQRKPVDFPHEDFYSLAMTYSEVSKRIILYTLFNTWEWTGTNWIVVAPSTNSSTAQIGCALAYDSSRRSIILTGGYQLSSTWELAFPSNRVQTWSEYQ